MRPHENIIMELARERERQIASEGWTLEHDDEHTAGELAKAAAVYCWWSSLRDRVRYEVQPWRAVVWRRLWPWHLSWWKPSDRRRDLVKAAALIVAEIERLDRAAQRAAN